MLISVIIPMYNEEALIEQTINRLLSLHVEDCNFELIFSDDGSQDRCAETVKKAALLHENISLIENNINRGKGAAIREGVLIAKGDIILYTDCDLAYGTEQLENMVKEMLTTGSDIVIGSRNIHPNGHDEVSFLRKLTSKLYTKMIALYTKCGVSDSQTGLKCFKGSIAKDIFSHCIVNRFAFDLEVLLLAKQFGYSISEFPVCVVHSDEELNRNSKVHLIFDVIRMMKDVIRIKKRIKTIERVEKNE
ncbi:MAG: glycosyltransferase [Clostridia bacterium]|nr:glycosyltransferase [Clostridia bacterium]